MSAQCRATKQDTKERMDCHGNNWTEGGPGRERLEDVPPLGIQMFRLFKEDIGHSTIPLIFVVRSVGGRIGVETQTVNMETSDVHAIRNNTIEPTC